METFPRRQRRHERRHLNHLRPSFIHRRFRTVRRIRSARRQDPLAPKAHFRFKQWPFYLPARRQTIHHRRRWRHALRFDSRRSLVGRRAAPGVSTSPRVAPNLLAGLVAQTLVSAAPRLVSATPAFQAASSHLWITKTRLAILHMPRIMPFEMGKPLHLNRKIIPAVTGF